MPADIRFHQTNKNTGLIVMNFHLPFLGRGPSRGEKKNKMHTRYSMKKIFLEFDRNMKDDRMIFHGISKIRGGWRRVNTST